MTRCPTGSDESFGNALRERRRAAGLTQRELAEAGGASVATIRDLEQGRTRRPRPALAGRLARALRLDAHQAAELLRAGQNPAQAWWPGHGWTAAGLQVRILGPLAAWRDGVAIGLGGPRQRAVLGLLAVHQGTGLHREAVIDALWGEEPPATAVSLVQAYVSRLRRVLDPGRSPRDPRGVLLSAYARYALQATARQLDMLAFGELADRARAIRSAGDAVTACGLYEQALDMWQAEPLADVDVLRHHPAIIGLGRTRAAVIASYADAAFSAGLPDRVLPHLRELAGCDPLDEKAHAQLMIALAATGQQAAALRVYDNLRRRLDCQLGMRPGRELTQAHLRVLRQDVPCAAAIRNTAYLTPPASAGRHPGGIPGGGAGEAPDEAPGGNLGGNLGGSAGGAPGGIPAGQVPRQLPAAIAHFVGRTGELMHLTGLLEDAAGTAGTVMISAIGGTAGVGKTALAVYWAHQVADRFPDGQLYVNLRGFDPSGTPVTPAKAVRRFLGALGVTVTGIPADLDARADLYRSMLASRRMLIVLDNARDPAQVRPLLPGSPGCLVVVTSRNQLTSLVAAEGAWPLTLDVLTGAQAWELLARRLGTERIARQPQPLGELIRLCARLPLALSLAAACAATRPCLPLTALAAELKDEQRRLDVLDAGDPAASLRAAFSSSYRSLSGPAARMFRLLGVHPGPDISAPAAASLAGIPLPQARDALRELAQGHLLAEHTPGRFAFHDLLRAYAAGQAQKCEGEAGRRAALHRIHGS